MLQEKVSKYTNVSLTNKISEQCIINKQQIKTKTGSNAFQIQFYQMLLFTDIDVNVYI